MYWNGLCILGLKCTHIRLLASQKQQQNVTQNFQQIKAQNTQKIFGKSAKHFNFSLNLNGGDAPRSPDTVYFIFYLMFY